MTEEQVNSVRLRSSSESSLDSTASDYSSDGINENGEKEPLMKMVECTTEDFLWDVNTRAPITSEYDPVTEMNKCEIENYYYEQK